MMRLISTISHRRSRSLDASSLVDMYSVEGIPSLASLDGLTGEVTQDTLTGLVRIY